MLNLLRKNKIFLIIEIALVIIIQSFGTLQSKAQSNSTEFDSLRNIQIKKDFELSFPGEDESRSIQDNLPKLEDYSISDSEPEVREEDPEWGNRGDVKSHSVDFEVYGH